MEDNIIKVESETQTLEQVEVAPKEVEVKTFTQEELDAIISERIGREKSKYGDLESKFKEASTLLDKTKTDVDDYKSKLDGVHKEKVELTKKIALTKSGSIDDDYIKFKADSMVSEEVSFEQAVELLKIEKPQYFTKKEVFPTVKKVQTNSKSSTKKILFPEPTKY